MFVKLNDYWGRTIEVNKSMIEHFRIEDDGLIKVVMSNSKVHWLMDSQYNRDTLRSNEKEN